MYASSQLTFQNIIKHLKYINEIKEVALCTYMCIHYYHVYIKKEKKQNNRSHVDMLFDLLPSQITAANRNVSLYIFIHNTQQTQRAEEVHILYYY